MQSDRIKIDNKGTSYDNARAEAQKVASFIGLGAKDALHLQLLSEELLSLANSVTGEMDAEFWLEWSGKNLALHLTTETRMDAQKREQLLSASTSGKNEITKTFLGKVRDMFEQALESEASPRIDIPGYMLVDVPREVFKDDEWDGYERSILRKIADNVKIGIEGTHVDLQVSKKFA